MQTLNSNINPVTQTIFGNELCAVGISVCAVFGNELCAVGISVCAVFAVRY